MKKRLLKIPAIILYIINTMMFPVWIIITWLPFGNHAIYWYHDNLLEPLKNFITDDE